MGASLVDVQRLAIDSFPIVLCHQLAYLINEHGYRLRLVVGWDWNSFFDEATQLLLKSGMTEQLLYKVILNDDFIFTHR